LPTPVKGNVGQAQLDFRKMRCRRLHAVEALLPILLQYGAAAFMGDNLRAREEIVAIHMVRMVMRVHHITDSNAPTPPLKLRNGLGFTGKWQGVNQNRASVCEDQSGGYLRV